MLFVVLRALCNTAFAQLLRLGQERASRVLARSDSGRTPRTSGGAGTLGRAPGPQTLGLITVNYLVATLASLVLAVLHRRLHYLPPTVGLGVLGGVAYIVSILLFMPAMHRSGVSVAVAVLQLAILCPVAYAMVVSGEMPSRVQWVGMAAAMGALVLLSMGRAVPQERKGGTPALGRRFSPLLLLLFFVTGISGVAMKAFHEYAPAQDLPGFMAVLFGTATAGGALAMVVRREPLRRADLALGAAIGLPNAAQLEFLLRAMETVPAIIVFPVSSALALVLNVVAAILWWGERLDRATGVGLVLALAATVLLNRG
jgi:drug/metabolite transporter (DMT)-like permease